MLQCSSCGCAWQTISFVIWLLLKIFLHFEYPIPVSPVYFLSLVCDPVMGDEGRLYVPQELVSVYREKV